VAKREKVAKRRNSSFGVNWGGGDRSRECLGKAILKGRKHIKRMGFCRETFNRRRGGKVDERRGNEEKAGQPDKGIGTNSDQCPPPMTNKKGINERGVSMGREEER